MSEEPVRYELDSEVEADPGPALEHEAIEGDHPGPEEEPVRLVPIEEFGAVDEPGATPILGSADEAVIVQNGDAMLYGDGGASKTTLSIDLGLHLATGEQWLGIEVPRPLRVLLIEAEGPRPLFRRKLRRKLEAWQGRKPEGHLMVWETPWARFRFPSSEEIAAKVAGAEIDVLIVGPLTSVGMDELGTLQEVRDFMKTVDEFRRRTGRPLTVLLIHHENKGGKVSGAWEGAGETLLHATVRGRGTTTLHFQKTRWSSGWHKQTLELEWVEGEGFEVIEEPERDLVAELHQWLAAEPHHTAKEAGVGIHANETAVRMLLEARQDLFERRTGEEAKAVGRHPSAQVWSVKDRDRRGAPEHPAHLGAPALPAGEEKAGAPVRRPVGEGAPTGAPAPHPPGCAEEGGAPSEGRADAARALGVDPYDEAE